MVISIHLSKTAFDRLPLIQQMFIKPSNILFLFFFLFAFAAYVSAQNNPFPNELEAYEFFGKGRLKAMKFGESKRKDVQKLFGDTCEKAACDYDSNFLIKFDYLDLDDCMTTKLIRDRLVCPVNKYIGTIEKISLYPKQETRFDRVPAGHFTTNSGGGIYPKDGSNPLFYESFEDEYGLKYSFKRETSALVSPAQPYLDGILYSIEYTLSDDLINTIFKAPYNISN